MTIHFLNNSGYTTVDKDILKISFNVKEIVFPIFFTIKFCSPFSEIKVWVFNRMMYF